MIKFCFGKKVITGIISQQFFESKLNYIHQNPVRADIVEKEEEYLFSSCSDYFGIRKGFLEIELSS